MGSNFPNYSVTIGKIFPCLFFSYMVLDYFSHWYNCKIIEDGSRTKKNFVNVMVYSKFVINTKKGPKMEFSFFCSPIAE